MSNLKLPSDDKGKKKPTSMVTITIWVIVGAIGLYYVINGLIGVLTK
jgi:hypothetical protein